MTIKEFAVMTGISVPAIYRYIKGGKANRKNAYHIEKLTERAIKAETLLGKQNNGRKKGVVYEKELNRRLKRGI
jgi:predicted site-specific integrase-resolvase